MCSTLLLKRLTVVMTEATSQCFIARLGPAPPDLESRLIQWASSSCQAHCVVRDGDGRVALYLHRKDAKTVRAMQSLIRTLTGRWGLHMGDLGKGWLELCSEEEYQAAASAACGATTTPRRSRRERHLPCGPVAKRVLSYKHCRLALTGGAERCIGN